MTSDADATPPGAWLWSVGLLALLLAYAAWIHHGVGPAPSGFEFGWSAPRAFLFESEWTAGLLQSRPLAFLSFGAPALLLGAAIALVSPSAWIAALGLSAAIALQLFLFYGLVGAATWQLFGWRASAVLIVTALPLGFALMAPRFAAAWRRLGWPLRIATYAPFVAFAVGFLRNATGTDASLPFAISPWPAVPVFGLEVGALFIAIFLASAAAGLYALARDTHRAGFATLALITPAAALGLGGALGLFPFRVGPRVIVIVSVVSIGVIGWVRWRASDLASAALRFGTGALLVAGPVLAGEALAYADYTYTRDVQARHVIEALDRHLDREEAYPDDLAALVGAGDLQTIPKPSQGFGAGEDGFAYQNFGLSYLLEFTATRWVQCAYTPAVQYEDEQERLEAIEELGEGAGDESWSCPSRPPELW